MSDSKALAIEIGERVRVSLRRCGGVRRLVRADDGPEKVIRIVVMEAEAVLASTPQAPQEVVERVAPKAAMFMFDTWGDAEGVVWNGLSTEEKDRARKAVVAILTEARTALDKLGRGE